MKKKNQGYGGREKTEKRGTYRATCSGCGRPCQVPFKPNKEKPVYCDDCFVPRNVEGTRDDRKMYKATCAGCRKKCEVPFKPSKGKEIYCKNCFGKDKNESAHAADKHDEINAKLDKILALLEKMNKIETKTK